MYKKYFFALSLGATSFCHAQVQAKEDAQKQVQEVTASEVTQIQAQLASSTPLTSGQDISVPAPPLEPGNTEIRNLELSAGTQHLSAGLGNWRDLTLKGVYGLPDHVLQGEVALLRRFDKDGVFVGFSDTYTFNDDWYGSAALGVGDGAFYLPRYRVDATLYKKWLETRNFVTSAGVGYYSAPDGHTDQSLSLGLAYYFDAPWVAEAGVRMNKSNPGSVSTHQQYVAVSYGRSKQDLVSARYGWGSEGYQAIATNTQLVNFKSQEATVTWRHWVTSKTGLLISGTRYTNPTYTRSGLNVGIFYDF